MSLDFSISPLNANLPSLDRAGGASAPRAAGTQTPGESFTDSLMKAGENLSNALSNAEATSIQGIKGEANSYEVASAVMEAEQTLRMAISVRDKVVSAYLEISRMQI